LLEVHEIDPVLGQERHGDPAALAIERDVRGPGEAAYQLGDLVAVEEEKT
jgi:hypothetical protein